jgi:DNA topoisomerase-1
MKLLIVESPSKAKTIEKYFGGEYVVRASVGHVRDLPASEYVYIDSKGARVDGVDIKKLKKDEKAKLTKIPSIDIEHDFKAYYVVDPKKEKVIAELKSLAKKANTIYLATDPDREGEAIAWHIKEILGIENAQRVTYQEITHSAIEEALKKPRDIDWKLKDAQEARRVLDRLVGYDLSSLIWKKVRYGLSAGRVQSPALRIIVEREKEIREFIPETYFELEGDFETVGRAKESKKYKLHMNADEVPTEKSRAEEIKVKSEKQSWSIADIKETNASRSPSAPFTTSSIQQAASTRLGFSPSRTMSVAQKLYEKGLITYMRTDSTHLSATAVSEIATTVVGIYGKEYYEAHVYKSKSKNAQEAHEAIRPTHVSTQYAGTTEEEKKLYSLIWRRTITSQMANAKTLRTKVIAISPDTTLPTFSLNGSVVTFDGWLRADPDARGDDVELPKLEVKSDLTLHEVQILEKQTAPPSRYTEAGLVKELEKRGIGRPSTYASIISTIENRGYVEKQNKALYATTTGEVVSDFLTLHFDKYVNDAFTADMENKLDDIANGDAKYAEVLREFYTPFHSDVESKTDIDKVTNLGAAPDDLLCPKCGSHMIEKLAKNGTFYSCSRFPDCDGARKMDGLEMAGPRLLGKPCPKCDKGELVEREGKYGKFVACSLYPKCKYIEESEEEKLKRMSGVKCNHCSDGYMSERRGRFGTFYSCSNYPDCKHIIKTKPTGNLCKICGELMMEGTKTIPERCSIKTCPNHNPHKM